MWSNEQYLLELTEEQARIVSIACEFYARVKMGQFNEIIWNCLDIRESPVNFCARRDAAEHLLLEARKQIYPDLHSPGHSYGIGHFVDADLAYDIHQVVRRMNGRGKREPFTLRNELPKMTIVEVEEK